MSDDLKGLADARAWALAQPEVDPEWSAVMIIQQLLDTAECALCHQAALECGGRLDDVGGGPFAGGGLCDVLSGGAHDVRRCPRLTIAISASRHTPSPTLTRPVPCCVVCTADTSAPPPRAPTGGIL